MARGNRGQVFSPDEIAVVYVMNHSSAPSRRNTPDCSTVGSVSVPMAPKKIPGPQRSPGDLIRDQIEIASPGSVANEKRRLSRKTAVVAAPRKN